MTTRIRTLCILAGLAVAPAAALAQAISLTVDGDIFPGETITLGMNASYGGTDYAIAGIATSLLINESQGTFDNLRLVAPMDGPGTTPGVLGVGSIDGILAGQLNFPTAGIYADPTNPIAFWEADFTIDGSATGLVLDIETVTTRFDTYIDMQRSTSESRLADLTEGAGQLFIIPAPASGVALLGGLAFVTRRRR